MPTPYAPTTRAALALLLAGPLAAATAQQTATDPQRNGSSDAQITVQQAEPVITVQQEKAQVEINKAEPAVEVIQADPKLKVTQGKPELQVEQSPHAQIVVEQTGALDNLRVSDFEDRAVYNSDGDELGEIEELVIDPQTRQLLASVEVGGFLGLGEKEILVDFNDFQLRDDKLILTTASSVDELKSRPEYDDDQGRYLEVDDDFAGTLGELREADFARFETQQK